MADTVVVNMGQYAVAHNPTTLMCAGLGSCVGVAIYDPGKKIGGLAHVMLPYSKEKTREGTNQRKYADVAIPEMVREMEKKGCIAERMVAKIAGGAHMFKSLITTELMKIGERNDGAVREQLKRLGVKLVAYQTGDTIGRTLKFDTVTGKVSIKTVDRTIVM